MLPRENRIPSSELSKIMRFGSRVQTPVLSIVYRVSSIKEKQVQNTEYRILNTEYNRSRFAFVVSTKIDKRATRRNRMRRLMSESVRLHLKEMKAGTNCVCIAKKGLAGLSQTEVEMQVLEALRRAGLYGV